MFERERLEKPRMINISPSPAGSTPEQHDPSKPPPSRRRDKPQLSCTLCRRRKLKCDRNQPCETCSSRGLSHSCTYVAQSGISHNRPSQSSSTGIQNRIGQLEGLVISLMNKLNTAKRLEGVDGSRGLETNSPLLGLESGADAQTQLSSEFGRMTIENAETSYVSSPHWISILDGIAELKDQLQDSQYQLDNPIIEQNELETEEPELLYCRKKATKFEILAAIPPRPVVDRLVSRYFNSMDMSPAIIHGPTFLREYERFWEQPLATPTMWIGLLFTLMCLALQFQYASGEGPTDLSRFPHSQQTSKSMIQAYREKIVQCLTLDKYTKSVPYTLETLLLYMTTEHLRYKDTSMGTWIVAGIIIRLALRLGYHRDPSHTPRISVFQGEMRRRIWLSVSQLDMLLSSQIGLPRMIRDEQSDTLEPRNVIDDDLDENMTEAPISRPETEQTPILYAIIKFRITRVFGQTLDLITNTRSSSYSEIMRVDQRLHDTQLAFPAWLKSRPMRLSITDSPHILLKRIYLDLIFHTARCVLHRKYLIPAHTDAQYSYSRQSCIDGALEILKHQTWMYQEAKPGGLLYSVRWTLGSHFSYHFLLASTILCLELDHSQDQSEGAATNGQRQDNIIRALQESYKLWLQLSSASREARRASEAIRVVLAKFGNNSMIGLTNQISDTNTSNTASPFSTCSEQSTQAPPFQSNSAAAVTMDPMSFTPSSTFSSVEKSTTPNAESMFDWDMWDTYLQTPGFDENLYADENLGVSDSNFLY